MMDEDKNRRDALLNEVRTLFKRYPDDEIIRRHFAMALHNAIIFSQEESSTKPPEASQSETLLDEQRRFFEQYQDDATVREFFAMSLCNLLSFAVRKEDFAMSDIMLDELRSLHTQYPDDNNTRNMRIKGLTILSRACNTKGMADDAQLLNTEIKSLLNSKGTPD